MLENGLNHLCPNPAKRYQRVGAEWQHSTKLMNNSQTDQFTNAPMSFQHPSPIYTNSTIRKTLLEQLLCVTVLHMDALISLEIIQDGEIS